MINPDFKWLVSTLDNPYSVVNEPEMDLIREQLLKLAAEIGPRPTNGPYSNQ